MKIRVLFTALVLASSICSAAEIEFPVYPGSEIEEEDSMQSSKPGLMMRDVLYQAPGTTEQVLEFYKNSPFIHECGKNPQANNYICKFNRYKQISSGSLFISGKTKRGKTEVYASYFAKK